MEEPTENPPARTDSIRWWIVAPAVVLVLVLLGILVRGNRDKGEAARDGKPDAGAPVPPEANEAKGPGDGIPRLFEAGDSRVREFLDAHPDDPTAVLAIARMLWDNSFLQAYKNQFRDDPVFAIAGSRRG